MLAFYLFSPSLKEERTKKKVYSTAAFQTRTTATVNKKAMKIQTSKGEGEECATTSTTTTKRKLSGRFNSSLTES